MGLASFFSGEKFLTLTDWAVEAWLPFELLMLAELGTAFIRAYSERSGLKAYTEHTLSNLNDLTQAAYQSTAQGYAYDNEEAEIGVGCIGVLIHGSDGNVVAGLPISAPIERRKEEWVELLRQAVVNIEKQV